MQWPVFITKKTTPLINRSVSDGSSMRKRQPSVLRKEMTE
jgi:hypothetical protein